jgi:signal transduction histidine kinase
MKKNRIIFFLRKLGPGFLFRSLRAKIILGVSLILILVTGSFTYYETTTRIQFELKKQEERAFDISAAVLKGIEYPMLDGEMEDVQEILQKVGMLEGLEVVKLIDLFDTIRYSTDPDSIGKVNESEITLNALRAKELIKGLESYKGKKVFSHAIPIHNEQPCFKCHGSERDILGVLTVGINWGPIEERIAALRNQKIAVEVISLVILAFFLIRWLSRYVTHPILKVTEFANEVSRGKLNAKLDLGKRANVWQIYKTHPGDEIVQLRDSLTYMLENMRGMYEKISLFSKDLESQVAKRTEELEQKTAELERANIDLKKLDELRSTFLANMSHELRTPLNSIIGYTELLLDRIDGDITEEQENSLAKVHNNAKNLLNLINEILDMSRIESGRVELDVREIDVRDIIQTTVSSLEPMIHKKALLIDTDFDENLPLAYADPDRVRQVITNLLSNAIKFTSEGRIILSAKHSPRNKFVEICISDTGMGIREEDLGKLFDMFTPLDISAIRPHGGVGLGLSICKRLVEMQNGNIWVESKYGVGSKFYFTLPVKE